MSVDWRRTQPFCTPECFRACRCSRWPGYLNRFGWPVIPVAFKWWDPDDEGLCVWAAYQPKGAASFAASLTDLSGNGNDAIDPGGMATPGWNAVNGWVFDGLTMRLHTTFVPQADQSQSMLVQYTNVTSGAGGRALFGAADAALANFFIINPNSGLANVQYYNGNVRSQAAPVLLTGNLAIGGTQGYRNGVPDGGAMGAYTGPIPVGTYIGAYNQAGVGAVGLIAARVQAHALYDCVLTGAQITAIAAAMAAL